VANSDDIQHNYVMLSDICPVNIHKIQCDSKVGLNHEI